MCEWCDEDREWTRLHPPPPADWKVLTLVDHGVGQVYRFAITGLNLNSAPHRQAFSWSVPSLANRRFDLTAVGISVPPHRTLSCGCCTLGCCCFMHQDVPRGRPPVSCALHARIGRPVHTEDHPGNVPEKESL